MNFTLLGKQIEISEGRKNYMKVLLHYRAMAEQAERDFKKEYDDIFGLVFLNSTYAEKFKKTYGKTDYMDNIVMRYVTKTRQYLTSYGVYDLSDSEIWSKAIVAEDRSVSRLQYNFNSFMESALYNDDFDLVDDSTFISRLKSKFEANAFLAYLRNDIMALCDFVVSYLHTQHITEIQFVYQQDAKKAEAYYRNLLDTVVTKEDELKLLESTWNLSASEAQAVLQRGVQKSSISISDKEQLAYFLIELDPRSKLYYEYIFENFPHARYEIVAIARYLGIDMSSLIAEDIEQTFNLKKISTEEDALRAMADLQATMEKYGISKSAKEEELKKLLLDFDIKARTYDGVLYDSRDLRAQAENDDSALENLLGDVHSLSKIACNNFLAEIAQMQRTPAVKNKYVRILNDRIAFIDNEYLASLLADLDSHTETECNEIRDKIECYDASEVVKAPFLARIEKRIYAIWDTEDFTRFSEIYVQTQVSNSEQIGKSCALIRDEGRTESKERFIKALQLLNDNEVEVAAKYALAKEGGMFSSILNMGKKETYEILTLSGSVMHPAILAAMDTLKAKKSGGFLAGFKKNKPAPSSILGFTSTGAKFCTECGSKLDGTSKFCSNCGAKV